MEDFDKKCKIEHNDELGRYVTAAMDIKAGETILLECPVLILPSDGEKRCVNCFRLTKSFCNKCRIFPLCENCSQHYEYDCKLLADMKDLRIEELQNHSEVYGPIKALLLHDNKETANSFDAIINMEAHMDKRRNTEIWAEHKEKVVSPILNSGLIKNFSNAKEIDEELLQKICAIVDVNCYEIRAPDVGIMRGVYRRGGLFAHHCVANVAIAIDENYQMKMYTNREVAKGEMFSYCYTNVLLGTDERRDMLKIGKYFNCTCERCEDPTELGTHMSSFICARCAVNQREGYVVNKKSSNQWQCITCDHTLRNENVAELLERAKEEIFHAKGDIYRYELLLAKLGRYFHRNHYLMIDLKQNVAAILRSIIQNIAHHPGRKVYERKVQLCKEILNVLNIIQPGISRMKAIVMYELSNSLAELYRMRFNENELSELELMELLKQTEAMLREAIRLLLYEPIDTPEGKLSRSMLKELKDLQNDMQLLERNIKK